jgi:hypothetical protein
LELISVKGIERLHKALESLGLTALQARLENVLERAVKKEPSYADFLDELLSCRKSLDLKHNDA